MKVKRNIVRILKKVRRLLNSKDRWNKGHPALDKEKHPCPYDSPYAYSWCLSGAIQRVCLDDNYGAYAAVNTRYALSENIPVSFREGKLKGLKRVSVVLANDLPATTYEDIMEWIDHVICQGDKNAS